LAVNNPLAHTLLPTISKLGKHDTQNAPDKRLSQLAYFLFVRASGITGGIY